MTGIERLREFAKGCRLIGQKAYSNAIDDIADQIEREAQAPFSRVRVLAVISEDEGGVRLYDVLDRVSCWCCRNKNLKELEAMRDYLPAYYDRLVALENVIGEPMKRRALAEKEG